MTSWTQEQPTTDEDWADPEQESKPVDLFNFSKEADLNAFNCQRSLIHHLVSNHCQSNMGQSKSESQPANKVDYVLAKLFVLQRLT